VAPNSTVDRGRFASIRSVRSRKTGLDHVETDWLQELLSAVTGGETTAALMLAIAYDRRISAGDRGTGAGELASWYGQSAESVDATIAAIDSPDYVAEIDRLEGVDVDAVDVPFAEFADRPVSEAASESRERAEKD
jgi:hypothetical protein